MQIIIQTPVVANNVARKNWLVDRQSDPNWNKLHRLKRTLKKQLHPVKGRKKRQSKNKFCPN